MSGADILAGVAPILEGVAPTAEELAPGLTLNPDELAPALAASTLAPDELSALAPGLLEAPTSTVAAGQTRNNITVTINAKVEQNYNFIFRRKLFFIKIFQLKSLRKKW